MKIIDIFETVSPVVPFWVKAWLFILVIFHPIEGKKLAKILMEQRADILRRLEENNAKIDKMLFVDSLPQSEKRSFNQLSPEEKIKFCKSLEGYYQKEAIEISYGVKL
jgi:hypothetical protein